jgi:hypothetical protein
MTVIQVTQVMNEYKLKEIAKVTMSDGFERLRRVFPTSMPVGEKRPVWIDLMSEDGQDLLDEQITISASQAKFLLKDFFKLPKKIWSKVKLEN